MSLLPEKGARHAAATQLLLDKGPVGHRPLFIGRGRRLWKQKQLEPVLIQSLGQRPSQARMAVPLKTNG